jgi:hypothetical protein
MTKGRNGELDPFGSSPKNHQGEMKSGTQPSKGATDPTGLKLNIALKTRRERMGKVKELKR